MIALAGVALGERAGNILAAAHRGEEGSEVIADALIAVERCGGVGDVLADLAGGDVVCELGIVGVVTGDVVVDGGDLLGVGLCVLAELGGLLTYGIAGGELHVGGRDEVRRVLVFDLGVHGLAAHHAVGLTGEIFAHGDGIGAIALIEGERNVLTARAVLIGDLAALILHTDLQLGAGGVVDGDEAVPGVGRVDGRAIGGAGVHHAEHGN